MKTFLRSVFLYSLENIAGKNMFINTSSLHYIQLMKVTKLSSFSVINCEEHRFNRKYKFTTHLCKT